MTDPFISLRLPSEPLAPDPAFAARLRDRLSRALDLPEGVTVSDLTVQSRRPAITAGASLSPYLAVRGASEAIAWYSDAFGAELLGAPIVMPDGRVGHAEMQIGSARMMLSDEHPEIGVVKPAEEGASVTLYLQVEDVDAVLEQAVEAGADLQRAAADYDHGRNGVIRDPFGHRWMISGPRVTPLLRHGDVGYVSLWVADVDRAASFFSAVLGWDYEDNGHRRVAGHELHHGLVGEQDHANLFCCYAVADVAEARRRILAAGGQAGEIEQAPFGLVCDATDDGGTRMAVFQPPQGVGRGDARMVSRQGEIAYITMEVVDSERARRFYGSVLDWHFRPGSVADGWQVEGPYPMVGLSGGHDRASTIPMYRVDDIEVAVAEVRRQGGTATDPETQPYGVTSECQDDQGTRFYLGVV